MKESGGLALYFMKALKAIGKGEVNAVEDSATEQHNTGREEGRGEWKRMEGRKKRKEENKN